MDEQRDIVVTNEKRDISESKAIGGYARAQALTSEERKKFARKAALARWDTNVPQATHEGVIHFNNIDISAAVLPNGKRLLTQATFLRALGRSRSPKAGTGVLSTVDGIPFFLQAEALKPFISEDLMASTTPLFYRELSGRRAVGYEAELLPGVAEVYLKMRDAYLQEGKPIPKQYAHIIRACDIIMRGLARVGIVALVDEATGFQYDRARTALADILERFIAKEVARWVKTFPDEYYQQIFRLRGWEKEPLYGQRPQVLGRWTNDIVYARLAPGVLDELKRVTPKNENGRYKHKLFQRLTPNPGVAALREHLASVTTIMALAPNWKWFIDKLDRRHPKINATSLLPFPEID